MRTWSEIFPKIIIVGLRIIIVGSDVNEDQTTGLPYPIHHIGYVAYRKSPKAVDP